MDLNFLRKKYFGIINTDTSYEDEEAFFNRESTSASYNYAQAPNNATAPVKNDEQGSSGFDIDGQQSSHSLFQRTEILGGYCFFETPDSEKKQEHLLGRYSRENQLVSASACTSYKANIYINDALSCKNTVILDKRLLIRDFESGEMRIKELTPLMVACIMGNMQTVKKIVTAARETHDESDFNLFINVKVERKQGGNNALLYAINSKNSNSYMLVHYLIMEAGANCNIPNDFERNSLLIAARRNQLDVVQLLLQKDVSIEFQDANGCNALHIVSTNGYIECLQLLLAVFSQNRRKYKTDFDIDAKDKLSLTPLMKASINNHVEIVKMLLNYGANPRIKTERGESSLTLAVMQENREICEQLILAKADVNELDYQSRTPLLKAARHNSTINIIKLLIQYGAQPDTADNEGNTPLHCAAQRGTIEVAKFLLQTGAQPYARNHMVMVPYEVVTNDEIKPIFVVCPCCLKPGVIACTICNIVKYCDVECQKKDFAAHKRICKLFTQRNKRQAAPVVDKDKDKNKE